LSKFGDGIRVECGKTIDIVGFIEDLNTDDVVDLDELLNEVGEDVHGELDVGGIVEEILDTIGSTGMALTVLGSGSTMEID
jgi:hypothetical protein